MVNDELRLRPVLVLPNDVARKIAAGEVIDRPSAVVRELLDNAIDAGATKITVEISGGGVDNIRVADNGCGMTEEDLTLCAHAHTTSKIREEDDLLSLATLGFRGEALSSIDAVSRLEITTTRNGHDAWKLSLGKVLPSRLAGGTIVSIDGLFDNFPARKQFIKRASAETLLCRQIFTEKALAWPAIEFRFSVDGNSKKILLPADTLLERSIAALEPKESDGFFHEISGAGTGFTFSVILGSPDVIRSDRKNLMVFVNGRRIMEYALLQAIEYGTEGHFPNGAHPFGILFITIDPSLVDFNIHPAKREARFREAGGLHHAVSSVIRDFYRRYTFAEMHRGESGQGGFDYPHKDRIGPAFQRPSYPEMTAYGAASYTQGLSSRDPDVTINGAPRAAIPDAPLPFRFLGQVLGTFLAVEKNGALFLIDQHAAHERILYDELWSSSGAQELLIPYRIETSDAEENRQLEEKRENLMKAGFSLEDEGDGIWLVTSVPARWKGTQKDLAEELLDPSIGAERLVSHIYASAACRAACRDGDILDQETAKDLAFRAFALGEPVCPHGRPIWIVLDRDELFRRIKRT